MGIGAGSPLSSLRAESEQSYTFNDIELKSSPQTLPDEVPALFLYPGASPVFSGTLEGGGFMLFTEGAVVLSTEADLQGVESYYLKELNRNGWSIIQSNRKEGEVLIMAESPFQKLITIILRQGDSGKKPPTLIKIYFKRSGAE